MSSGTITVVGLLVVFSALAILYFFFILLGKIFSKEKSNSSKRIIRIQKKEEVQEEKKSYVKTPETSGENADSIPVAAITAAIACTIGDNRGFSIRSIEPASSRLVEKRSLWKSRQPQVYWRPRRNK